MTVYAITDTKKGRTGIAPTYLHTTPNCVVFHSSFAARTVGDWNQLPAVVEWRAAFKNQLDRLAPVARRMPQRTTTAHWRDTPLRRSANHSSRQDSRKFTLCSNIGNQS